MYLCLTDCIILVRLTRRHPRVFTFGVDFITFNPDDRGCLLRFALDVLSTCVAMAYLRDRSWHPRPSCVTRSAGDRHGGRMSVYQAVYGTKQPVSPRNITTPPIFIEGDPG